MTSSISGYAPSRGPTGQIGNKTPSGYRTGQLQQFTPEQQQLFSQLFSHAGPQSYLSRLAGGDQSFFNEMEAPALRQFNEFQGNIASRFSGMGMGARKSSGFQNASNSAASNFAQDLQSQRQNLQRQAIMDLMGISHQLLGERPYEQYIIPKKQKQPGFFGSLFGAAPKESLGALGSGLQGAIGGGLAGGPLGALTGGLGNLLGSFRS